MKQLLLATAAILLAAGAAHAAVAPTATATLAAASTTTAVVTDRVVWKCEGMTCTTRSVVRDAYTVTECRTLAQKTGATVTAYGVAHDTFDADRLTRCNAK